LKGKRSVVKSIKDRVKNKFNVSVAEIDFHDVHQRASIGMAMIGTDGRRLNSALDRIVDYLERSYEANLVNHQIEIM
jgi:uncharacterized protein YlxP (DUF503 family)